MESIKDRVAIVGMGCCKFGERWDSGPDDLLVESCYGAMEDAGIESKDIQACWFGTTRLSTAEPCASALKFEYIPVTRVENLCATGSEALRNACFGVASGMYDICLAIGVEKLKDQGAGGLGGGGGGGMGGGNGTGEMGAGAAMFFARMASRYMYRYGYSYDDFKRVLAKIDVKNHHNGSLNPKAHFQRDITEDMAINAPMVAWPLGLYDACGVSDGCAAAIVCRADMAKSFRDDYVLVKGLGLAVGARQGYLRPSYDMTHMQETVAASEQAYAQAGIKRENAVNEINFCEVHDCFSITELVIMEDLGFAPRGKAPELIKEGFFELNGHLSVNPDGGLKSFGHPIGASGLRMAYEVYKQLQGKAGPRQRKNPKLGLAHNFGLAPGSGMGIVSIFGARD